MLVRGTLRGALAIAIAICTSASAIGARSAWAQRVAVVTVPAAGAPETAGALLRAAANLGGARGGGDVTVLGDGLALARSARGGGAVPAAQLAAMARVIEAGAEGWRAYLQVAVPFAASRLGKARSDAEALLPLPGGLELYADLSLRLGAALLSLGRADEAEDALALALTLDPEREVSLVEFSPDIVEAVERARQRPAALATLQLETPGLAGASIEIDGVPLPRGALGSGPWYRVTVPRGQHVIVARHRDFEAAAQAVRVPAEGAEVVLRLGEDRIGRALTARSGGVAGMSEEQALSLVEGVLTYADADEVLLLAATSRRGAPALLAQRCGGGLRCTAVVEIGYAQPGLPAAMRQAWATLARGELRYPPSLPSDPRVLPDRTAGGEGKCRLCRSPWLWAGVGAAVAVSSAVLIYALGQERPPPILTVDPGDF